LHFIIASLFLSAAQAKTEKLRGQRRILVIGSPSQLFMPGAKIWGSLLTCASGKAILNKGNQKLLKYFGY
jgi:hypothetical protein